MTVERTQSISELLRTPREVADALHVDISDVTEWMKWNPNVVRITKNIPRIPSYVFQSLLRHPERLNQRFPKRPSDRIAAKAIACCQEAYVTRGRGFIYFIVTPDKRFVKIGTALDPKKRFVDIQTGSPYDLSLHFTFPGGGELELRLHTVFRGYWVRGEWFKFCASIKNFIEALNLRPWLTEVSQVSVGDLAISSVEVEAKAVVARNSRLGGHRTKYQAVSYSMPDIQSLAQQSEAIETAELI